jgi:hypothetical protein
MAEIPVEHCCHRELYMKTTLLLALAFAVVSLPAAQPLHAAPRPASSSQSDHVKKVQMTLRNDSAAPMQFKVGDDVVNLDAGKSIALKLPVGTRICANQATATHQAGELIVEASLDLDHATLHVK